MSNFAPLIRKLSKYDFASALRRSFFWRTMAKRFLFFCFSSSFATRFSRAAAAATAEEADGSGGGEAWFEDEAPDAVPDVEEEAPFFPMM